MASRGRVNLRMKKGILDGFYYRLGEWLYGKSWLSVVASRDPLTGVYSRGWVEMLVGKMKSQARRSETNLSLVYLDVDELKKVNDRKGHKEGDRLLKRFCKEVIKRTRESDSLFRVGGDEFVLMLWEAKEKLAEEKMKKMREKMKELGLSFSYGVVEMKGKMGVKRAMEKADKRMYEMKKERC